jgi:hypothetical protein
MNLLPRSWLFEIVDINTKSIEASFTLVLPPQQMSVKEPQRVAVTKTFGNVFIDDYGPDNKQITLRGISGTSSVFPTFSPQGLAPETPGGVRGRTIMAESQGNAATQGYDARSAFYTFRDSIMRYKSKFALNFDKKELRVYDLFDEQAYKCVLLDFTLDRTAERPFWYQFSISLLVYQDLLSKDAFAPKPVPISANINTVFDNLNSAFAWATAAAAPFHQLSTTIGMVNNTLKLIRARWNTALSDIRFVIESPLKLSQQMLEGCLTLMSMVGDAYLAGTMTIQDYTSFMEVVKGMVGNTLRMYGIAISTQSKQSNTITINRDAGLQTSEFPGFEGNDRESSAYTFTYYGYTVKTLSPKDTLQSLALEYLGDVDKWPFIASANGIRGNSDLASMETIYIPVSIESPSPSDSFILSEDPLRDPFGSDLRLDSEGNVVVGEGGDLALSSGISNVLQAINVRMSTSPGSLIRQTAFGLLGGIGNAGTEAALSYVRTSFRSSLLADSRITSVSNVQVMFSGGSVFLSADIDAVGVDRSLPLSVRL